MSELKSSLYGAASDRVVESDRRDADNQVPADMRRRAAGGWSPLGRQLCKRVVNIDARKDSVSAVRAYIEYGWNLNPKVGF